MKETAEVKHGCAILRLCYPYTETSQEARTRFQDQLACCTSKTYASRTTSCAATTRLRPHVLYVDLAVRRDYSSLAARALRRPRRALRLLVTRPHGLYVNLVVHREYSFPDRSGSTSTTPYAAATSSSGRTTTSTSRLNQKTSRGRLPRHQQLVGSTSD
jgi:hypothetical protein